MRLNERGFYEFTKAEEQLICEDFATISNYYPAIGVIGCVEYVAWGWRVPFTTARFILRKHGVIY